MSKIRGRVDLSAMKVCVWEQLCPCAAATYLGFFSLHLVMFLSFTLIQTQIHTAKHAQCTSLYQTNTLPLQTIFFLISHYMLPEDTHSMSRSACSPGSGVSYYLDLTGAPSTPHQI